MDEVLFPYRTIFQEWKNKTPHSMILQTTQIFLGDTNVRARERAQTESDERLFARLVLSHRFVRDLLRRIVEKFPLGTLSSIMFLYMQRI